VNENLPPNFWDEPDPPPPREPSRILRRLLARLTRLMLVLAVVALLLHFVADYFMLRAFEDLRSRYIAMEVLTPAHPEGENALTLYRDAAAKLARIEEHGGRQSPVDLFAGEAAQLRAEDPPPAFPEDLREQLREGLGEAAPALDQLRQGHAVPAFHITEGEAGHLHPLATPNPEDVRTLRLLARYAAARAWHEALEGNHADAAGWTEATFALARRLDTPASRVLALLRISVGETAVSALLMTLAEGPAPSGAVAGLSGHLEALRAPEALQHALAAERDALLRWQSRLLESQIFLMRIGSPLQVYSTVTRVRQLEQAIAALNETVPSAHFEAELGLNDNLLRKLGVQESGYRAALLHHEAHAARTLLAQIVLQLAAWRVQDGQYPETLDALWERRFRIPGGYNPLEFRYAREANGYNLEFAGRTVGHAYSVPAMMWRMPR